MIRYSISSSSTCARRTLPAGRSPVSTSSTESAASPKLWNLRAASCARPSTGVVVMDISIGRRRRETEWLRLGIHGDLSGRDAVLPIQGGGETGPGSGRLHHLLGAAERVPAGSFRRTLSTTASRLGARRRRGASVPQPATAAS